MKRLMPFIFALLALGVLTGPVVASNHQGGTPMTKKDCEDAGGTWTNDRGEKTCTFPTATLTTQEEIKIVAPDWPESDDDDDWDVSTTVSFHMTPKRMQQGAIAARGTSDTFRETVECRAVHEDGRELFFSGDVCASIYERATDDDGDRS